MQTYFFNLRAANVNGKREKKKLIQVIGDKKNDGTGIWVFMPVPYVWVCVAPLYRIGNRSQTGLRFFA